MKFILRISSTDLGSCLRGSQRLSTFRKTILTSFSSNAFSSIAIASLVSDREAYTKTDLIVLGGDPLASLEALKDIRMIVNDGTAVFAKCDGVRPGWHAGSNSHLCA